MRLCTEQTQEGGVTYYEADRTIPWGASLVCLYIRSGSTASDDESGAQEGGAGILVMPKREIPVIEDQEMRRNA